MASSCTLPGIGRKTANVVLGNAFDVNEGVTVDTHVLRVTNRLGLARGDDPLKIEAQLMALVPRERWTRTTDLLIFHGRQDLRRAPSRLRRLSAVPPLPLGKPSGLGTAARSRHAARAAARGRSPRPAVRARPRSAARATARPPARTRQARARAGRKRGR